MPVLRLGLLQYGVTRLANFEDFAAKLNALIAEAVPRADLLVLPEYAVMELAGVAPCKDAPAELALVARLAPLVLDVMREAALRYGVWLLPGTLPWLGEDGIVRNRAPLIAPDGRIGFQDKTTMTRFEAEEWGVQPGNPPGVFTTPWGRIGVAVCYDVEFPLIVRSQIMAGAWLILAPSCTDSAHGFNRVRTGARARAMENQCFTAIAPTVGDAPWLAGLDENYGLAGVYTPIDRGFPPDGVLIEGELNQPGWLFATLDPAVIQQVRQHGAVFNHADWRDNPGPARDIVWENFP